MNNLHKNPNQIAEQLLEKLKELQRNPVIAAAMDDIDRSIEEESVAARKCAILDLKIAESNHVMHKSRHTEQEQKVEMARNLLTSAMSDLEVYRESVRDSTTRLNAASRRLHSLGESYVKTGIGRVSGLIVSAQNAIAADDLSISRAVYPDCQYREEVEAKRARYRKHRAELQSDLAHYNRITSELQELRLAELSPKALKTKVNNLLLHAGLLDPDEFAEKMVQRLINSPENLNTKMRVD